MTMLCRGGKLMSESDRLGPLLKNLTNSYMGVSEGDGLADRLSLAELASMDDTQMLSRLCLKMLDCTPAELPPDMLQRLRQWAATAGDELLQAFIRWVGGLGVWGWG